MVVFVGSISIATRGGQGTKIHFEIFKLGANLSYGKNRLHYKLKVQSTSCCNSNYLFISSVQHLSVFLHLPFIWFCSRLVHLFASSSGDVHVYVYVHACERACVCVCWCMCVCACTYLCVMRKVHVQNDYGQYSVQFVASCVGGSKYWFTLSHHICLHCICLALFPGIDTFTLTTK